MTAPPNTEVMEEDENSPQVFKEDKRPTSAIYPSASTANIKFISSKALLLRLFQSEFFTAVQALHYLQKYSNEPGIQYYLCERLKELPEDDIELLIPQLW